MKTTFTLLFLVFSFAAFAQRNFVPGHYITLQGEKVEALINHQNWDRSPKFIEISENGGIRKLHVSGIKGFALSSGDVYDAFAVEVDKSTTNLNAMKPGDLPLIVSDTVFLRAIVKGAATLYYLRDENAKEHYYIRKGDDVPAELINRTIKVQNGSQIGVTKSPIYKGLLKVYLAECPNVADRAESLGYSRKALTNFVTDYNKCVGGAEDTYTATEEKIKFSMAAVVGISYNTLSFRSVDHGTSYEALINSKFSNVSPTFGISMLATLPRVSGRWSLQAELMYKNIGGEDTYSTGGSNLSSRTYETKFDIGLMSINTAVRYKVLDNNLKPFVKLGFGNSFVVSENNSQKVIRSMRTETNDPFPSLRKHEQSLIIGAGVELSRFTTEFNAELGNGFSSIIGLSNARDSYMMRVGYRLF